jgi:CRP-like cAMP-binding protein
MGCGGSKDVKASNVDFDTIEDHGGKDSSYAADPSKVQRRAGVSAETDDPEEMRKQRKSLVGTKVKPEEVVKMIERATAEVPLFADLTEDQIREVVDHMVEMEYALGDTVIKQGDKGEHFFVCHTGEFKAYLKQVGDDKPVKEYSEGGIFGELALMYNTPRAATIRCTSDKGTLWALDRWTFRGILMAANKSALDSTAQFLKSVPLLSPLTDVQRDALSNVLTEHSYIPNETIVREGEMADALYLVKEGEVAAWEREGDKPLGRLLGNMGQGQFFGESALSTEGSVRQATVVTRSRVKMLKLTSAHFNELFGDLAEVIRLNFNQKVLGSMEMFKELGESEKTLLIESLQEETFAFNEEVFAQGAAGDKFYIIKTGSVKVSAVDKAGKATVIKEKLGPSEYFGEMALLSNDKRMATVTATSPTVCMVLPRKTFRELLGEGHDIVAREAENRRREVERAQRPPILMSDLKQLAILGVGTFGRVKLVLHTKDKDRPYALKCMRKGQVVALKQVEHVINEKKLLEECNHPFLLHLAATFQDEEEIYMLLELALGGELFSVLRKQHKFEEKQGCFYAACVCAAFSYMHDRQIVYRDLKPENLLFDDKGYLKVVDFGFAKKITDRTWTLCGTPEYLAPEIITNKGHNLAVDWWAFGVLIFEMLFGQPPFCADDPMEIYQKILKNKVSWPSSLSKHSKDLVAKLLVSNPSQRLGSLKKGHRDISGHTFFKHTDWKGMVRKSCKAPYIPTIQSPTDTSNFDDYDDEDGGDWARFNDKRQNLFKDF